MVDPARRTIGLSVHVPVSRGQPARHKSERAALAWSLGATAVPTLVGTGVISIVRGNDNAPVTRIARVGIAGGVLLGPAAGHWYAERPGAAWRGVLIRIAASLAGLVAFSSLLTD